MDKLLRQFFKDWRAAREFRREYRRVSRLELDIDQLQQIDAEYDQVEEAFETPVEAMSDMNTTELATYLLINRDPFKFARALKTTVLRRWQELR